MCVCVDQQRAVFGLDFNQVVLVHERGLRYRNAGFDLTHTNRSYTHAYERERERGEERRGEETRDTEEMALGASGFS